MPWSSFIASLAAIATAVIAELIVLSTFVV